MSNQQNDTKYATTYREQLTLRGMVLGGLAFTLPGIWMIDPNAEVSFVKLLILTLGGVLLGLIFTSILRKHFIEKAQLPFAMGQSA